MKTYNFIYYLDVQRMGLGARNAGGSPNQDYSVIYPNLPCSYETITSPKDPSEIVSDDVTGVTYSAFYMRYNFKTKDIKSKDQIIYRGETYDVVTSRDADGTGQVVQTICKKVDWSNA